MCSEPEAWQLRQRSVMASGFAVLKSNTDLLGSSACSPPGPWQDSQPCIAWPPRVSSMVFQCGDFSKLVVMSSWQLWQVAESVEASAGASTCLPWLRGVAELGFACGCCPPCAVWGTTISPEKKN